MSEVSCLCVREGMLAGICHDVLVLLPEMPWQMLPAEHGDYWFSSKPII